MRSVFHAELATLLDSVKLTEGVELGHPLRVRRRARRHRSRMGLGLAFQALCPNNRGNQRKRTRHPMEPPVPDWSTRFFWRVAPCFLNGDLCVAPDTTPPTHDPHASRSSSFSLSSPLSLAAVIAHPVRKQERVLLGNDGSLGRPRRSLPPLFSPLHAG
jgi:hypothetical protein